MFRKKMSKWLICLLVIVVLVSTSWAIGRKPAKSLEPAEVEEPQAEVKEEAKAKNELAPISRKMNLSQFLPLVPKILVVSIGGISGRGELGDLSHLFPFASYEGQ